MNSLKLFPFMNKGRLTGTDDLNNVLTSGIYEISAPTTGVRSEQTIYRILDSNGVPRRPKVRGVRKIFVTIEEDVAAILDKEQSVSLYVNEAIRYYHSNRH